MKDFVFDFDGCETVKECIARYHQYFSKAEEYSCYGSLDWAFFAYIADNLIDEIWNAMRRE